VLARVPIRLRLTIWYIVLLALVLAIFSAGVYLLLRHALYQNLDDSIDARAEVLLDVMEYAGDRPRLAGSGATGHESLARVFDRAGTVTSEAGLASGAPVDDSAIAITLAGGSDMRRVRGATEDDPLRVKSFPVRSDDGVIVGVLEVGLPLEDVTDTLGTLLIVIAIAYPATLAVASVGGAFLARRALSPIDEVTKAAHRISAEDLGQRLALPLPDDEVGRLAQTFDEMIARLDDAFRRQRQFTADASHELRTPLTAIKGQIEVALQKDRDPAGYRHVMYAVNAEVDRLIRLSGSLLTLTRADAGQIPLTYDDVDVASVVGGVSEQLRPAADAKEIRLVSEQGPPVAARADEDLVLQLMINLLDNAIKYTPSGGTVSTAWRTEDGHVELRVRDTGPGIASEHLPHLFDRFYRVDGSRSRAEGGVGLGLAISRWIAEVHGGSIDVASEVGSGSTFTVRLPLSS
jgi:heavy metal sensor kinase